LIILACIALGLALRVVTGRSLRGLAESKLRGESLLLVLLVSQAALPLVHLTGGMGRVAFFAWLATFPCMIAIAWLNWRELGMPILGLGLLMNAAVIVANGGMPVFEVAAQAARVSAQALAIPAGDFVHVVGGAATRLPWLADVIPFPGPEWFRIVVSPGDLLLFAGVVALVATLGPKRARGLRAAE
jgi:hypothetical protein